LHLAGVAGLVGVRVTKWLYVASRWVRGPFGRSTRFGLNVAMDEAERSDLERIAQDVAAEWGLVLGPPFQLANHSYVSPVSQDAVLKIGWQKDEESVHEADALELWAGNGAVRLLRADRDRRALLLERAVPGDDIAALGAATATALAIDVARRLWSPAGTPFRWIGDYVAQSLGEADPESAAAKQLLQHGRRLFSELNIGDGILVHGDLHHHNILAAGTGYVAIDPKPMLGEPEFDVPPFLWSPLGSQMTEHETERRLDAFAQAGLDQTRMRHWALIRGAYQCVGDWIGEDAVQILQAVQPP
jgi:streptomycin 6-kinase